MKEVAKNRHIIWFCFQEIEKCGYTFLDSFENRSYEPSEQSCYVCITTILKKFGCKMIK
jgi:hypothetical protein